MKLDLKIDLSWPSYEDDISTCIKDAVLSEVRSEVNKQTKLLRERVAEEIKAKQSELIDRALRSLDK